MSTLSKSVFALIALLVLAPPVAAADAKPQTDHSGAVTVKVTPLNIARQAVSWNFEVELNTHTAPLDQDMARAAALIDGMGNERLPLAWDGDAPGGHHRKGVLRFQPLPDRPKFIELRLRNIGGVGERVFRWGAGDE
jgi:hypothetical protein